MIQNSNKILDYKVRALQIEVEKLKAEVAKLTASQTESDISCNGCGKEIMFDDVAYENDQGHSYCPDCKDAIMSDPESSGIQYIPTPEVSSASNGIKSAEPIGREVDGNWILPPDQILRMEVENLDVKNGAPLLSDEEWDVVLKNEAVQATIKAIEAYHAQFAKREGMVSIEKVADIIAFFEYNRYALHPNAIHEIMKRIREIAN